ncbi:hypothetical protein M0R45_010291 [Rubus argutus]|uniref:Cytochrome P450 n=1 Tax=Rubus argutus TaxID=59490 RepID=A0AAW1Y6X5_RUBAR
MEDCKVGGFHIPKGTLLFVNLWKLHKNPNVWSDPEAFFPERFLTSQAGVEASGQHFEFIPFGSGRAAAALVCKGLELQAAHGGEEQRRCREARDGFHCWRRCNSDVIASIRVAHEEDLKIAMVVCDCEVNRTAVPSSRTRCILGVSLCNFNSDVQWLWTPRSSAPTVLILAGSDTTSISLTWTLALLLNNRHALKLAQEELDRTVGRHRWVEDTDLKNLVYLQAIVKETLRLYPPAPLSLPHEAMEDCKVGGFHIPKGTHLFVNLWKLHRDPSVWSDPEVFSPERFLTSQAGVDASGQHFEFIPFGSGRRVCPGITFAFQVIHLTLARLIQGFELGTPMDKAVDMTEGLGITMPRATSLEVILTPRLASRLYPQ